MALRRDEGHGLGRGEARQHRAPANPARDAEHPRALLRGREVPDRALRGERPAGAADTLADADGRAQRHARRCTARTLPLKVAAARLARRPHATCHVHNATPVVLSAHDLGMDAQLAALKAVCGHQSLSAAVPIDFDVAFAPSQRRLGTRAQGRARAPARPSERAPASPRARGSSSSSLRAARRPSGTCFAPATAVSGACQRNSWHRPALGEAELERRARRARVAVRIGSPFALDVRERQEPQALAEPARARRAAGTRASARASTTSGLTSRSTCECLAVARELRALHDLRDRREQRLVLLGHVGVDRAPRSCSRGTAWRPSPARRPGDPSPSPTSTQYSGGSHQKFATWRAFLRRVRTVSAAISELSSRARGAERQTRRTSDRASAASAAREFHRAARVAAERAVGRHALGRAADALELRRRRAAPGAHELARVLLLRQRDVGEREVAPRARRQRDA